MDRVTRVSLLAILSLLLVLAGAKPRGVFAQTPAAESAELRIGGAVSTPLVLTVADLKKMARKKLTS
jgi:DMSO/TMAO reductase YedYZ molybdopterin-dependent catalytic subunit